MLLLTLALPIKMAHHRTFKHLRFKDFIGNVWEFMSGKMYMMIDRYIYIASNYTHYIYIYLKKLLTLLCQIHSTSRLATLLTTVTGGGTINARRTMRWSFITRPTCGLGSHTIYKSWRSMLLLVVSNHHKSIIRKPHQICLGLGTTDGQLYV